MCCHARTITPRSHFVLTFQFSNILLLGIYTSHHPAPLLNSRRSTMNKRVILVAFFTSKLEVFLVIWSTAAIDLAGLPHKRQFPLVVRKSCFS